MGQAGWLVADCGTGRHFRTLARADSDRTARRR